MIDSVESLQDVTLLEGELGVGTMAVQKQVKVSSDRDLSSLDDLRDLMDAEPVPQVPFFAIQSRPTARRHPAWLDNLFVWIVSLMIHSIIFLSIVIAYRAIANHLKAKPQPFIMPASFYGGTINSHHKASAAMGKHTKQMRENLMARSWSAAVSPSSLSTLLNRKSARQSALEIGLGSGGQIVTGGFRGLTSPQSKLTGHIGTGPMTGFFGVKSHARRVVYLIDNSGSMIGKLHLVKRAVNKSIRNLLPFQKFTVIVFSHDYQILGPRRHLLPARRFYRKAMEKRLNKILAEGANDNELLPFTRPFKAAFATHPDVIYFLTDGHFDKQLIGYIAQLDQDQHVEVCTFAFLDSDPVFQSRLRKIAWETGGKFEYVSRRILEGR